MDIVLLCGRVTVCCDCCSVCRYAALPYLPFVSASPFQTRHAARWKWSGRACVSPIVLAHASIVCASPAFWQCGRADSPVEPVCTPASYLGATTACLPHRRGYTLALPLRGRGHNLFAGDVLHYYGVPLHTPTTGSRAVYAFGLPTPAHGNNTRVLLPLPLLQPHYQNAPQPLYHFAVANAFTVTNFWFFTPCFLGILLVLTLLALYDAALHP